MSCATPRADTGKGATKDSTLTEKLFSTTPERFRRVIRSNDGMPTVVNAWASWCIPCRAEMPRLVKASERYAERVRFLGLNTQDADDAALRFIEQFKIPFRSGTDPTGKVARSLRLLGLPATLFYSVDGDLNFVHNGEIQADDLRTKIDSLLQSSGHPDR